MGIFVPAGDKILPKQTVTNAEALAWVREARFRRILLFPPMIFMVSWKPEIGERKIGRRGSL